MKHVIVLLLAAAVILSGCKDESHIDLITIALLLDTDARFQPLTFVPDIPLEVAEYRVYGNGPASTAFEIVTAESACVIEEVLPGQWVLGAEGYNETGTLLYSGESETAIERDTGEIILELYEPAGEGSFSLAISWEESLVPDAALEVTLSKDGTAIPLAPVIEAGTAAAACTAAAGLYELTAVLSNAGEPVAGAADYVKIAAGFETTGEIALNVVLEPVSPMLTLHAPKLSPCKVKVTGYDPPVFTGDAVTLTGATDTGQAAAFSWFVDGVPAAAGASLVIDTANTGTRRIDLLASAHGYASGGSATLEVSVYEPVFYGSLVFIESVFDNAGSSDGLSDVRDLALSEEFLYTAGYGEDEIGIFKIDEASGKLLFTDVVRAVDLPDPDILTRPSALSLSAGLLAAGCSSSGALISFAVDFGSGFLSYLDSITPAAADFPVPAGGPLDIPGETNPLLGVSALVSTADGGLLFAAGSDSNTITSYKREAGEFVPYQIVSDDILVNNGFDPGSIDGPEAMAISPDGAVLAVVCRSSDTLLVFNIKPDEGTLLPAAVFKDGVDAVDGLNGASGVCFSPGGGHIYATGYYDDAVSLFTRDTGMGAWGFTGSWDETDFADAALHYPRGITVNPDSTELYVCAGGSDAFTVFQRDTTSGLLSAAASAVNGNDRNTGLDGIRRVLAAGAGNRVYTASSNDNAIGLFRRE